ncbi:MAG: PDZ domain-containing protein [Planctomycetes bacterium]|nr:PDZ domain-containing protein [Planctomycetota bacterium]
MRILVALILFVVFTSTGCKPKEPSGDGGNPEGGNPSVTEGNGSETAAENNTSAQNNASGRGTGAGAGGNNAAANSSGSGTGNSGAANAVTNETATPPPLNPPLPTPVAVTGMGLLEGVKYETVTKPQPMGLVGTINAEIGVKVTEIGDSSPIKSRGLQVGDVILRVNETEVRNAEQLKAALENSEVKTIRVQRGNEAVNLSIN